MINMTIQIGIEEHNKISTSDNRLLRRIVRDSKKLNIYKIMIHSVVSIDSVPNPNPQF